ncbi:MAG: YcgN family cysteine cluster protein [Alphaproteobacteria bacterium]|nr:YcgN family cysteine cluster protein [Alphaproteobacteria bacterium]
MAPPMPFWKTKTLAEMSVEEWESLCDGCGRCCLHKVRYEESGGLAFTNVACRLLNLETAQCSDYTNRRRKVPDCVQLTVGDMDHIDWLPPSCAYRLIDEGKPLAWWHPLVSGDPQTVHEAGVSIRGRALSEKRAGMLEHHLAEWPGQMPRPKKPRPQKPTEEPSP